MDFFEKAGEKISAKGRDAADKARILAETAKLKSQISTCDKVIQNNYLEIGRLYYQEYRDVPDAPFGKQCQAVSNAEQGKKELQEKIDELKMKL